MLPFRYRVDALRVDGVVSADPRDYADYPASTPVGAELHAYVTAELSRGLAPTGMRASQGGVVRWPVPNTLLLTRAPTVEDLRRWGRVRHLVVDPSGAVRPIEEAR